MHVAQHRQRHVIGVRVLNAVVRAAGGEDFHVEGLLRKLDGESLAHGARQHWTDGREFEVLGVPLVVPGEPVEFLPERHPVMRAIHAETFFAANRQLAHRARPVARAGERVGGQRFVPFPRQHALLFFLGREGRPVLSELRRFVIAIHRHQRRVARRAIEGEVQAVGVEANLGRLALQGNEPGRIPIRPTRRPGEPHHEPRLAQSRRFDDLSGRENLRSLFRGDGHVARPAQTCLRHVLEKRKRRLRGETERDGTQLCLHHRQRAIRPRLLRHPVGSCGPGARQQGIGQLSVGAGGRCFRPLFAAAGEQEK